MIRLTVVTDYCHVDINMLAENAARAAVRLMSHCEPELGSVKDIDPRLLKR
jgi:hypothetical protein